MTGRTPTEALHNEIDPIQKAINCITVGRLALVRGGLSTPASTIEAVSLNRGEPAPVRSALMGHIFLKAGLWIRIPEQLGSQSTYHAAIARYSFQFLDGEEREFLGYH